MSACLKKRAISSRDNLAPPVKSPPKKAKMVLRYPVIKVLGEMDGISTSDQKHEALKQIHPTNIIYTIEDEKYTINWLHCENLQKMDLTLNNDDSARQFLNSTKEILQPLDKIAFDPVNKEWIYKDETAELNLQIHELAFTQGFIADMANSRGRIFITRVLESCFKGEDIIVSNLGGRAVLSEPSVRCIKFDIKQIVDVSSSITDSEENEPENLILKKRFVPDVIIETKFGGQIGEHLVVEVKKGSSIKHHDKCQLKYILIPSAIKEHYALGLIICTKEAYLIKLWKENHVLLFGEIYYTFRDCNLVEDLAQLLLDVRCFIQDLKEKKEDFLYHSNFYHSN